jgi:hypothetical protein
MMLDRKGQREKTMNMRTVVLASAILVLAATNVVASGPYEFYPVEPCRIADTRLGEGATGGPALSGAATRPFPVTGYCGVPATAKAAVLNVTVVGPTASGHLRIWPFNLAMPNAATLTFAANEQAIANGAIVPLTTDPEYNINVYLGTGSGGTAHLVIDVTGYFE